MTAKDLMLSAFAKLEDPNSGGRQMPGHFGQKKNRIVTGSSPVTTQVPHAVGIALAGKMDKKEFVSHLLLLEKAPQIKVIFMKEQILQVFINYLLSLCVKIINMRFLYQFKNKWHAKRFLIGQ